MVCRDGEPVGVISERDLAGVLAAQLDGQPLPASARDVMSSPAVTVFDHSTADEAMECVLCCGIRRLVVVDAGNRLAGLVTQTDLLNARTLQIEKQRASLARMVGERTRELRVANEQLRTLSLLDGLLEIGNRRAMEAALDKHHAQANRYERPYAVALLDVDHTSRASTIATDIPRRIECCSGSSPRSRRCCAARTRSTGTAERRS